PVKTISHVLVFFYPAPAPPALHALSLHDALPIFPPAAFGSLRGDDATIPLTPAGARIARVQVAPSAPPPSVVAAMGSSPSGPWKDRKSTRLNSSHSQISYAVFCLKKKKNST